jgi:hypothetical protein
MVKVDVGPFEYRVQLFEGLIDHDGQPCFGLCDNVQQRIYISDVPPPPQRMRILIHEIMHGWWFHFGPDRVDEESIVDLVGLAMTELITELWRGGDRWSSICPRTGVSLPTPNRQQRAGSWWVRIYDCP